MQYYYSTVIHPTPKYTCTYPTEKELQSLLVNYTNIPFLKFTNTTYPHEPYIHVCIYVCVCLCVCMHFII